MPQFKFKSRRAKYKRRADWQERKRATLRLDPFRADLMHWLGEHLGMYESDAMFYAAKEYAEAHGYEYKPANEPSTRKFEPL